MQLDKEVLYILGRNKAVAALPALLLLVLAFLTHAARTERDRRRTGLFDQQTRLEKATIIKA